MSDDPKTGIDEIFTPSFTSLISSIYSAVLYNLGELKIEGAKEIEQNLELAHFNIGLLEVLYTKTKGHLSEEEDVLLKDLIHNAKLRYTQHDRKTGES